MPGEYGGSPDVFFRGVPMGLRPSKVDEKHTHRRRPGEYGASPGVFFSGAASYPRVKPVENVHANLRFLTVAVLMSVRVLNRVDA